MAECISCGAKMNLDNPQKGEIVSCPECGIEMEVTNNSPVELKEAPKVEEDWGE